MTNTTLPPDPEQMNDERSDWAATALDKFRQVTGTDEGDALADLLVDLMHWCDRHPEYHFASELARAERHYAEETCDPERAAAIWRKGAS